MVDFFFLSLVLGRRPQPGMPLARRILPSRPKFPACIPGELYDAPAHRQGHIALASDFYEFLPTSPPAPRVPVLAITLTGPHGRAAQRKKKSFRHTSEVRQSAQAKSCKAHTDGVRRRAARPRLAFSPLSLRIREEGLEAP